MTTVLVVDDRATNRRLARATLDHSGYDVIEASGGNEALAIVKADHPDVVLTDVLMPGMDGYQFVRELRSDPDTAGIPVLFFTSNYRHDEAQPLAATFGVSRVLSKAAGPLELLQAIEEALRDRPEPLGAVHAEFSAQHVTVVNAKPLEKAQALDQSEARFAAMAETSPIGIVIGDRQGLATYVNPRLSEIAHIVGGELLGQGWQRCLSPEHRQALRATLDDGTDLGPDGLRVREHYTLVGGQSRWLTVVIRPVCDDDRAVAGFVAMVDDITASVEADERRRSEEVEAEREASRQVTARFDSLARLAGGVAHDFNNLLNVILSFDDFVKESVTAARGAVFTDEQAEAILGDVEQIHRASQRAAHLTHQLLTFGGREVIKPTPVDVNALIDEVRSMLAGTIGQHITITTRLDPGLSHVVADASQLTQVLINLAVNSRDAMPDGGNLQLATSNTRSGAVHQIRGLPAGEYVHVAVTDTGHGMPPTVVRQAMEPFFTTKPQGLGTGLGLATSYGVIKQAGGDLVIDSAPDRGTVVHIYLPVAEQPVLATSPAVTAPAATGQTVLLAEDEDGLRDVVIRHLHRAGYHVLAAPNGREALAIAEHHDEVIHALLTDVVMPVMNGPELAAALHQIRPEIPVLYMSGYAAPLMTQQGLLSTEVTVLSKPFTKSELLTALRTLTGQPQCPAVGAHLQ